MDGEIIDLNETATRLFGYKRNGVIGKEVIEFVVPEQRERVAKQLAQELEGEHTPVLEVDAIGKKGIRTLLFSEGHAAIFEKGKLVGVLLSAIDITARKQTEEELNKFKTITEKAGYGSAISDLKGNLIYVNESFAQMHGYAAKEIIGKNLSIFHTKEQMRDVTRINKQLIQKGSYVAEEVWHKRKDGSVFPTLMTGTLIRGRKEKSLFLSATVIDITQRKKAEEALLQSERLKALGGMAAGVAHDFNNLLAIILGNAQLLERGLKRYKSEEIKHRLKIIARTASEGGETVRRLQYFTRREVPSRDFTRLDLNEIVREAISSTSPRWKDEAEAKGITIRIKEKLGKLPSILGSRSGLMEVLTNLIFNALESMSEGGEITIRTEAKENEVLLYFTDSGKGIPDRIKEKIFHPFFTTKGPQASGLGLSVSYGIIKRHRGKIKVESSKGKGITFTISMPVRLESKKR